MHKTTPEVRSANSSKSSQFATCYRLLACCAIVAAVFAGCCTAKPHDFRKTLLRQISDFEARISGHAPLPKPTALFTKRNLSETTAEFTVRVSEVALQGIVTQNFLLYNDAETFFENLYNIDSMLETMLLASARADHMFVALSNQTHSTGLVRAVRVFGEFEEGSSTTLAPEPSECTNKHCTPAVRVFDVKCLCRNQFLISPCINACVRKQLISDSSLKPNIFFPDQLAPEKFLFHWILDNVRSRTDRGWWSIKGLVFYLYCGESSSYAARK